MNFADRVKETTTSTSAAVIVLGGAVAKFRSFASSLAVGDTGIPVSMDDGNGNWENGEYTLTNATTLTRTAIYASSNGGAPTVFLAGAKEVFCTLASETLNGLRAGMPSIVYSASTPVNTDGKPNNTLYFQTTPTNGIISLYIKLGGAYQPVGAATPIGNAATSVTMTGPVSGVAGLASSNYSVALFPAGSTAPAPIVVTPSDAGAGGTFSPKSLSLTTVSPSGAFTYTPASAGTKSISVSNNSSLTNPAALAYTVQAANPNPTITIAPSKMAVSTGSPYTANDVDGAPTYAFPNAQGQIHFTADTAVVGQKYDVYMLWSLAGAPGLPSPASVKFYGAYEPWTASSTPVYANKVINLVPPQSAGVVERSQLPFSFTREDAGRISHFKIGRQQDSVGGTMRIRGFELVPTPALVEASISPAGSLSPTSFNTPYSGNKVISLLSLYTPIWTTANAVYVVAPVTIGGVQQSRLAKLDKNTYQMIQDVQLTTGTHDTTIGHRDGSVCVTDDGKVIAYGEAHHTSWRGVASPTEDISALAATTAPTGLDTNCSYRRFFRNQFDGSMWMGARGNGYLAGIYKWNGSTFDRKGADFLAGNAASYLGSYGMEIAFASVDTLYVTTEFLQGDGPFTMSGYPRQNISLIKSTDSGVTFTTMRGKALNLPLVSGTDDSDIAFPNNNYNHNSSVARIAIGADGQPLLIASWQHPDEPFRSLWVAKYNTSTNKWVRTRLMAHNGVQDAGTPHVAYHNGKVIVTAATTDDNVPATLGTNNQLYIFTSTDSGASWKKYTITHPVGAYSGAYIDPAALRLDNKLRLLPDFEAQPNSVVWELPIPA